MPIGNTGVTWYDVTFLTIFAYAIIAALWNEKYYSRRQFPFHLWIAVHFAVVFIFHCLKLVDNFIVASIGLENGGELRGKRLSVRVVVLSINAVLYVYLWIQTFVGTIWFAIESDCLPANLQWGMVELLLFTSIGLFIIAVLFWNKWFYRGSLLTYASPETPLSGFEVLVSMIRHPNILAYEAIVPIYTLRDVPTDCSDYPICLEEFRINQEVRGLPCAHIFHVTCIDT
ncbi:E3 ubiquitin-protein ligase SIS3-like [Rutidosis leptorrhynchoides]|uniref:E3 ubiquitin-protein ligase SIS3-like n=1 Tax=Rutidosis leptorrhynchoides TaxID=125765 RepID=UPI003A990BDD